MQNARQQSSLIEQSVVYILNLGLKSECIFSPFFSYSFLGTSVSIHYIIMQTIINSSISELGRLSNPLFSIESVAMHCTVLSQSRAVDKNPLHAMHSKW